MRQKLDKFLNNYLSRKLMVFFIASAGLFTGVLISADWVMIATVYIGTQGVIDAISKLKK